MGFKAKKPYKRNWRRLMGDGLDWRVQLVGIMIAFIVIVIAFVISHG